MSQRVKIFLAALLIAGPAFALKDKAMIWQIQELRESLKVEPSFEKRILKLERFKEMLDEHIRRTPIVRTNKGKAEFAEMNEIMVAIFAINISATDKTSCARSEDKIRGEGSLSEDSVKIATSARIAIGILKLVCD